MVRLWSWCLCGTLAAGVGCIPYTVGTTAQPAPREGAPTLVWYSIPNGFEHLRDVALLASARQATFTPYGGVRASQVLPMWRGGIHDSPSAGGFLGVRIGREELGVSPEVGLYYDRSASGVRSGNVIVVPALVIHGADLIRLIGHLPGRRRTHPRRP